MHPDHDMVINYGAVLAAAVAKFLLGGLWYMVLFGEAWGKLMGIKPNKNESMAKPMAVDFAVGLVYAYGLACVADWHGALGNWKEGICVGLMVGVAFNATMLLASHTWIKRPFKLYLIDAGYQVVMACLMGIIIAAMTKAPEMAAPVL